MTTDMHWLAFVEERSQQKLVGKRVGSVVAHLLLVGASMLMPYALLWMLGIGAAGERNLLEPLDYSERDQLRRLRARLERSPSRLLRFFANSFIIAILAVAGNLITCSLAAYSLARLS